MNNFRYLLARKLAKTISERFHIPERQKQYNEILKKYENLENQFSNLIMQKTGIVTKRYLFIFTLLSGIGNLSTIISIFFNLFVESKRLQSIITISLGSVAITCFVLIFILVFIKNKKQFKKQKQARLSNKKK